VFAASLLILILLLVTPLLAYMPKAATAGVLIIVAIGIVDIAGIRKTLGASRADSTALIVTFLTTVLLTLDFAILLGILVSVVTFLHKSSRPRVLVRVPDPRNPKRRFNTAADLPECPQFKIVRIDGGLFFGAANYVGERLRRLFQRNPRQSHLLILARSVPFIDAVGADVLARESRRRKALGGALYVHQLNNEAKAVLKRGGYLDEIGEDHFFEQKGDAIAHVFDRLDRRICRTCTKRIFNECRTLPRPD
jgi:SulP family sulfate permease